MNADLERLVHNSIMASAVATEREVAAAFLRGDKFCDVPIVFFGDSRPPCCTRYDLHVDWWRFRRRRMLTKLARRALAK